MVKPWADGPFKLLSPPKELRTNGMSKPIIRIATEMSLAHNIMIRSLNAIYLQAPHVTLLKDVADFILYCQFWVEELQVHHYLEETFLFPKIEEYVDVKGAMEGNVEQHHAFEKGVEEFRKYVFAVKVEEFDSKRLLGLVDGFQGVLFKHLEEEIGTLLELDKYDGLKVEKAWNELEAKVLSLIEDKSKVLPFGLGANDRTFEGGIYNWPSFPFFVPYMVNWIYAWKYNSVWRFNPCTIYGKPKELEFVKNE